MIDQVKFFILFYFILCFTLSFNLCEGLFSKVMGAYFYFSSILFLDVFVLCGL